MRSAALSLLLGGGIAAGCRGSSPAAETGGAAPSISAAAQRWGIGRAATSAEIAAWDLDVNPAGEGLPPGRGSALDGERVWAVTCASCHGARGEGNELYPRLVGREPREGFPFGRELRHARTVGNYWPYATTLYDYVRRTMPMTAPGSLTADELYAVVAWMLAENEIIPRDAVIDASSLPAVRMPARDRFVPDDRAGGAEFR